MTAPFASIEERVNAAIYSHLANASGDFGGGLVVDGMFNLPPADVFGVIAGNSPVFVVSESEVVNVSRGDTVTINAVSYSITDKKPDGIGNVSLMLAKA